MDVSTTFSSPTLASNHGDFNGASLNATSLGASARGLLVIDTAPDASPCHRRHDGIELAVSPDGNTQLSEVKQDGSTNELCQLLYKNDSKMPGMLFQT